MTPHARLLRQVVRHDGSYVSSESSRGLINDIWITEAWCQKNFGFPGFRQEVYQENRCPLMTEFTGGIGLDRAQYYFILRSQY